MNLERTLNSEKLWWYRQYSDSIDFPSLWQHIANFYGRSIAYVTKNRTLTYKDLATLVQEKQHSFKIKKRIVPINGTQEDWLIEAIAAWASNKTVLFFNPSTYNQYQPHIDLNSLNKVKKPHAIFFTSGSTGTPKFVIRDTAFALFEAASYIKDLDLPKTVIAFSLIQPWFGAMTKHSLGMLLSGIPQYFELYESIPKNKITILYSTPSQLRVFSKKYSHQWDIISVTGEPLNASHVSILKKNLNPYGFVLDSFGSTECGVIARRKLSKASLDTVYKGFHGKILPGKKVFIDTNNRLSIQLKTHKIIKTDDVGAIKNNILHLYGRSSVNRKINAQWVSAAPLLNLLRSRMDIEHIELAKEQTDCGRLIVFVSTQSSLIPDILYRWLIDHLPNLRLLPKLYINNGKDTLGHTGKMKIECKMVDDNTADLSPSAHIIADAILSAQQSNPQAHRLPIRHQFTNVSLEHQGLDSLNIIELITYLEKKTGKNIPPGLILKTDTPDQISHFLKLHQGSYFIRERSHPKNNTEIILLGSGIAIAWDFFAKKKTNLVYTNIIQSQKKIFTINQLAQDLFNRKINAFQKKKQRWIAAYSIDTLLAIELTCLLETNNMDIDGIFLLDPPGFKRRNYLRKKLIWLKIRLYLMGLLIKINTYKNKKRYYYELRKIAIARQSSRKLQTKILLLSTSDDQHTPWIEKNNQQRYIKLLDINHIDLVKTQKGIESWFQYLVAFIK